jgi:hypothetical protein
MGKAFRPGPTFRPDCQRNLRRSSSFVIRDISGLDAKGVAKIARGQGDSIVTKRWHPRCGRIGA